MADRANGPGSCIYNAVGTQMTMAELLQRGAAALGSPVKGHWAPDAVLIEQGVGPWIEMPLWLPDEPSLYGASRVSADKAVEAGLARRPIEQTFVDTLAWCASLHPDRARSRARAGPRDGVAGADPRGRPRRDAFAPVTDEEALQRAGEWIAAWNSHDLERIMALYEDGFSMTSPHVRAVVDEPTGTLVGKDAVRRYWRRGLELVPHMHFILLDVFGGVHTLAIYYSSNVREATVVEVLVVGDSGRYASGIAMNRCRPAQPLANGA